MVDTSCDGFNCVMWHVQEVDYFVRSNLILIMVVGIQTVCVHAACVCVYLVCTYVRVYVCLHVLMHVLACVCLESLPVKEGGSERVHCTHESVKMRYMIFIYLFLFGGLVCV